MADDHEREAGSTLPAASMKLSRRLYLASVAILVVGGIAAGIVFLKATPRVDEDVVAYRISGGRAYPITLENSPREVRMLEAEGGRANVAAAELDDWIGSLWRGQRLSYALAAISVALAGLCAGMAHLSIKVAAE